MNDTDMIINPGREKGEPELPAGGILLINPAEAAAGMRLGKNMDARQYFLFNSKLALVSAAPPAGSFFIAGPAVGAPMAVLTLEKLIALGARRILTYGWCGSLSNSLRIGDVLLPTWAVSDEGTSAHYPLTSRPESNPSTLQLLIEGLSTKGLKVHAGPVWTTDAPYRESITRVGRLARQGILGVDMEYGALIAAASFRKVELSSILLVSDELWSGKWHPGFRTKAFKKKSGEILHYLAGFCSALSAAN
jgi:uridine phosphorylase